MNELAEVEAVLQQVQSGDRSGIHRLFEQYRPLLRAFVRQHLDNRMAARLDASDIVQEAQLEAFHRLPDYLERRPMPFRLWLLRTTWERLRKIRRFHLSAQRRTANREWPLSACSSNASDRELRADDTSPSAGAQRCELTSRVHDELRQLSPADRDLLVMRLQQELSNAEAACRLGIAPETAKKRYARALRRLRDRLRNTAR
jgi:RNA polymerase sigma-70 factor (ECF subfamily)